MFRASGNPREVWYEHLMSNPGSFASTAGQGSDDWRLQAGNNQLSPARVQAGQTINVAHDATAYSTIPPEEAWTQKLNGAYVSPAKVTAGATLGTNTKGALT
jgi:hypothetical protein